MRSNLEPLIDTLFEEDELFVHDFEKDGLHRILFIRKMGIYVEMKTNEYLPGIFCTPLFHCPRCKDHWTEFGTVPENCPFARQPTRGPAIHLASNRKPRFGARRRKTKRRLGDIKEGFVVSGSGTVLNELDENGSNDPLLYDESPQYHSNRPRAHSSTGNVASRDYLTSDNVKLENVCLREIDSTTMIEAFKEGGDTQKLDKETYVRTLAAALGLKPDALMDAFTKAAVVERLGKEAHIQTLAAGDTQNLDKETYVRTLAAALGLEPNTLMEAFKETAVVERLDKETYIQTLAAALGVESTTMVEAFKKVADVQNLDDEAYVKTLAAELFVEPTATIGAFQKLADEQKLDKDTHVKTLEAALGFGEDRYNDFARVNIKNTVNSDDANSKELTTALATTTSSSNIKHFVRMTLNSSVLSSVTVKDLPERVRAKMLSLLQLQRKRRQKQAWSRKNRGAGIGSTDSETLESEVFEAADKMRGVTEVSVRSRLTSSSGRRYSIVSDEEGSAASRSPSDVLAYKEIQSQSRSRKKNPSVRNRSGQPDTPHQRLGRPPISGPSNSSSFYSYDADSDEENWGRIQTRIGSSRSHLSDSRTSYRSDMSRAPHVTDSRGTMLRKYSSARGQRNVSFSNLDDQRSCGSLGNDDSMYDLTDEGTDTRSNRARRAVRKKEKGDGVKRPGNYHSKVIQDMNLGQENLSMSHVTASFGDINMMYGSNVRLSQGRISRISLADVSSALSSDSTVQLMNKRSSRPTSSITGREHAQKWKNALESEFARQDHDESTRVESWSEIINERPPLPIATESTVSEDSVAQLPAQAQHGEKPEKLFTRVERRKPLVVLEDLNVIHRLPVSSAFTFSFYELPSQHRKQNESIKKAASRIAHRPKKEFGHFRSRSAP